MGLQSGSYPRMPFIAQNKKLKKTGAPYGAPSMMSKRCTCSSGTGNTAMTLAPPCATNHSDGRKLMTNATMTPFSACLFFGKEADRRTN